MARHRFFYLLNLARHRVFKHADRVAQDELGVTAAQLGALVVVHARPGLRQRELAETLGYNESAVTGLLKRMTEAELVERVPSPEDRRVQQIRPTRRGAAIVRRSERLLARWNEMLTEGFTEDEVDAAGRFLGNAIERFAPEET